jgi:hypothetical protein
MFDWRLFLIYTLHFLSLFSLQDHQIVSFEELLEGGVVAVQFIKSLKFMIAGQIFKILEVIFFKIARG